MRERFKSLTSRITSASRHAGKAMVAVALLTLALYYPEPVAFRQVGTIIGAVLFLLAFALYLVGKRAGIK